MCYNLTVSMKEKKPGTDPQTSQPTTTIRTEDKRTALDALTRPTTAFTQTLAREIVKNLISFGEFTKLPFKKRPQENKKKPQSLGENPILVDTSVLIDGRILPIVNSGFLAGTLVVSKFVLEEIQHIADSSDSLRRAKGRRGLDVVGKLKWQKANPMVKYTVVGDEVPDVKEVDHKLVAVAKRAKARLLTVDFNLASVARAQGVKILNVNDLAQALKVAVVPGEELTVKITHEGKERQQGVGYLTDGTMIVVDEARDRVGQDVTVTITKVHQTAAGQLFFARLK